MHFAVSRLRFVAHMADMGDPTFIREHTELISFYETGEVYMTIVQEKSNRGIVRNYIAPTFKVRAVRPDFQFGVHEINNGFVTIWENILN